MDSFQKIYNIREAFDDKLYQTEEFKITKGLLYNFGSYIEQNKGLLYGLLGTSIFNIASNSNPVNNTSTAPIFNNPVLIEQMKNKLDSNLINRRGMDIYAKIESFKAAAKLGNTIKNHSYIGHEIHELNAATINALKDNVAGTVRVFENPFWKGNFVEINITKDQDNQFIFPDLYNFEATSKNSLLLVDNTEQKLYYNNQQAIAYANYSETNNIELMTKYIVYHESAHASFRQAFRLGSDIDLLKGEVHSDITSLTMIGVESKSLNEFNEAADMLMKLRVKSLEQGDYGHNDSYAISELKKIINENPDLLKMKVTDISEFSYILTDTLFKENVKKNNLHLLERLGITLDNKSIFNDLRANRNLDLYDSVGVRLTNNYGFRSESITMSGIDSRIENFAKKIEKEMKDHMQFDAVSTLMFRDNGGDIARTTKAIHDNVKKHPIILQSVIDPIKQKVHIDGLEYDLSKVNDIRLQQIAKESQIYVNKQNYKL